jgi:hypothetical protein
MLKDIKLGSSALFTKCYKAMWFLVWMHFHIVLGIV